MLANKLSGSVLILLLFNRLRKNKEVMLNETQGLFGLQDKVLIALESS